MRRYPVTLTQFVTLMHQARFPFKRNRLRCVRCVNENRKKRKRLRFFAVFIYATHATQAIAFERKPGIRLHDIRWAEYNN